MHCVCEQMHRHTEKLMNFKQYYLPPLQSYSEGTLCIAPFGFDAVFVLVDADEFVVAGRGADGTGGTSLA